MNKMDTHGDSAQIPATPIFDRLIADVGLSWTDAMPAANAAESHTATASAQGELRHSNGCLRVDVFANEAEPTQASRPVTED